MAGFSYTFTLANAQAMDAVPLMQNMNDARSFALGSLVHADPAINAAASYTNSQGQIGGIPVTGLSMEFPLGGLYNGTCTYTRWGAPANPLGIADSSRNYYVIPSAGAWLVQSYVWAISETGTSPPITGKEWQIEAFEAQNSASNPRWRSGQDTEIASPSFVNATGVLYAAAATNLYLALKFYFFNGGNWTLGFNWVVNIQKLTQV